MQLTPVPIRFFCDLENKFNLIDLNTGEPPLFVDGDDIEIDIGIGAGGNLYTGLTTSGTGGIASVTCQLFAANTSTAGPVLSGTTESFNTALTQAEWTDDTTPFYFANFLFANGNTGLLPSGSGDQGYWLRIVLTTTDTPAKIITLVEGNITVKAAPVSELSAPPTGGTKLVTNAGVPNTTAIYDPTTGNYYALEIDTVEGVRTLSLGDTAY